MREKTIQRKKNGTFAKLIFVLVLCVLAADSYAFEILPEWNLTVPHVNRGTLEKAEVADVLLLLGYNKFQNSFDRVEPEYLPYDTGLFLFSSVEGNQYRSHETRLLGVYRQFFKETRLEFYRVMIEVTPKYGDDRWPDMKEPLVYQKIYVVDLAAAEIRLLYADFYYTTMVPNTGKAAIYDYKKITNVMPIIQNDAITGLLVYSVESAAEIYDVEIRDGVTVKRRDQQRRHFADVFRFENPLCADLRYWKPQNDSVSSASAWDVYAGVKTGLKSDLHIKGTMPLFDKKQPFRYTIQNAFDQNPASSYVEDVENDYISIEINGYTPKAQKIRIINGYAANAQLYDSNNRIKSLVVFCDTGTTLAADGKEYFFDGSKSEFFRTTTAGNFSGVFLWRLKDSLDYQLLESKNLPFTCYPYISREENIIQNGSKYSDTCIAEIDYYIEGYGWLFGD